MKKTFPNGSLAKKSLPRSNKNLTEALHVTFSTVTHHKNGLVSNEILSLCCLRSTTHGIMKCWEHTKKKFKLEKSCLFLSTLEPNFDILAQLPYQNDHDQECPDLNDRNTFSSLLPVDWVNVSITGRLSG